MLKIEKLTLTVFKEEKDPIHKPYSYIKGYCVELKGCCCDTLYDLKKVAPLATLTAGVFHQL